jgi:starch phosphorylase
MVREGYKMTIDTLRSTFEIMLQLRFAKTIETSSVNEKYYALADTIMSLLANDWAKSDEAYAQGKQAYYFSLEFLIGRSLGNNMLNLEMYDEIRGFVESLGINFNELEEVEYDAALGNGGLGRLAACFMESAASMNLPVMGYGVRYSQGIFRQHFLNGFQKEEGDDWLRNGDPWSLRKESEQVLVRFGRSTVRAIPYDVPILGYDTKNVNTLRLWQAEPMEPFDFTKYNNFEYDASLAEKNRAEDITRVLYPNDGQRSGKVLRFKQQYFFVSASIQDMVRRYREKEGDFTKFAEYHAVQLNDTHPVIALPELMRILMDEEHMDWNDAWSIVNDTFSFTNHTILQEAMEQWPVDIVEEVCPRCYNIITQIDKRFVDELTDISYHSDHIERMRIVKDGHVRMAFLALHGCHRVNGVAAIHTEILKHEVLSEWYKLYPHKFVNKTNGITPRRWLKFANRELSALIDEKLGTDTWATDLDQLKALEQYADDTDFLQRLNEIKREKKVQLARYILEEEGIEIDPDSIFDIQIKRMHEYKRQLLNAFHIWDLYLRLKENPDMDMVPRTFIFGGKAAPGYFRAKGVIKYINEIAKVINNDESIKGKIKVVFVTNYRVSYGEKLFPAADISEQISTAGKEASGTGNMKFMLNATPTIGTMDGANVEIVEEAGAENNFIFGATVEEIREKRGSYDPVSIYNNQPDVKRVVDSLVGDELNDAGSYMFLDIYNSLVKPNNGESPDQYFVLHDFASYKEAQKEVDKAYRDRQAWAKKCLINMANAGKFSSDRTIKEYAEEIWGIEPAEIEVNQ